MAMAQTMDMVRVPQEIEYANTMRLCSTWQERYPQVIQAAATGLPNYPVFRDDPHLKSLHGVASFDGLMKELENDWRAFKRDFGG